VKTRRENSDGKRKKIKRKEATQERRWHVCLCTHWQRFQFNWPAESVRKEKLTRSESDLPEKKSEGKDSQGNSQRDSKKDNVSSHKSGQEKTGRQDCAKK